MTMKYLRRDVCCRKLFIAVMAVAVVTMAALGERVSNRVLLPRYFQHSLAPGEHLTRLNQRGKTQVHVVDGNGNERPLGELEGQAKVRFSIAYALLDSSLVFSTA